MDKETFKLLSKAYGPIVENIINQNVAFYNFNETIKWRFIYNEDISIVATCNRNDNHIEVNLKSFMNAYFDNDLKVIEYFLLHEIRHIFQHLIIFNYKNGLKVPVDVSIIKKWIFEQEHYIKALDENKKENPDYFYQDSELDAYAFSYAVMKYKYKTINVYVPPVYDRKFYSIVDDWIKYFHKNNI